MAVTIVESPGTVTGGVDTHLDVHVAAAVDHLGGVLGVESFPAKAPGYRALLDWLEAFGKVMRVGVEGTRAAALKPRDGEPVRYATLLTIRLLGRRIEALRAEAAELNALLRPLITEAAPGLLGVFGVGYDSAAKLLVAAGDNPERLRSE